MKKKKNKKTVPSLKSLQKTLHRFCPQAHPVSVFHLAIAITRKYRYFLTTDPFLLKKAKILKMKYGCIVCRDPLEAQPTFSDKQSPMEFYI